MHSPPRLRLAARLGLAFGILSLLFVALAGVAVMSLRTVGDSSQVMADRDADALVLSGKLTEGVQNIAGRTTTHLYVQDGDLTAQDATAKAITSLAATVS
jgi:hypothetical protein